MIGTAVLAALPFLVTLGIGLAEARAHLKRVLTEDATEQALALGNAGHTADACPSPTCPAHGKALS